MRKLFSIIGLCLFMSVNTWAIESEEEILLKYKDIWLEEIGLIKGEMLVTNTILVDEFELNLYSFDDVDYVFVNDFIDTDAQSIIKNLKNATSPQTLEFEKLDGTNVMLGQLETYILLSPEGVYIPLNALSTLFTIEISGEQYKISYDNKSLSKLINVDENLISNLSDNILSVKYIDTANMTWTIDNLYPNYPYQLESDISISNIQQVTLGNEILYTPNQNYTFEQSKIITTNEIYIQEQLQIKVEAELERLEEERRLEEARLEAERIEAERLEAERIAEEQRIEAERQAALQAPLRHEQLHLHVPRPDKRAGRALQPFPHSHAAMLRGRSPGGLVQVRQGVDVRVQQFRPSFDWHDAVRACPESSTP